MKRSAGSLGRDALRERLAEFVREARAAGRLDELRRVFDELMRESTGAVTDPEEIPMRHGMVGESEAMQRVFDLIDRLAPASVPVLVLGETGTGKELVARALHDGSPRRDKLFLAENCAAVPENLLESELFGHKKGSFTGATTDRQGHFVVADGGTVFLDEIGDMPLTMQSKLLRALQEGEVRPVGSNKVIKVDIRVVAATNKDLVAMCREGTFREDLYWRLNVVAVHLPPLRERGGDIAHLVRFILSRVESEVGRQVRISDAAVAALGRWRWPGNVRELENELQRAAVLSGGVIGLEDLSRPISAETGIPDSASNQSSA